jgi:hypothetical protein
MDPSFRLHLVYNKIIPPAPWDITQCWTIPIFEKHVLLWTKIATPSFSRSCLQYTHDPNSRQQHAVVEDCQVTIPKQACYIITKEPVKICDRTGNKVALTPQEPTQKLELAYNLTSGKCQACNEGLACITPLGVLCGTHTVSLMDICCIAHFQNVSVDRVLQSIQWTALLKIKWRAAQKN